MPLKGLWAPFFFAHFLPHGHHEEKAFLTYMHLTTMFCLVTKTVWPTYHGLITLQKQIKTIHFIYIGYFSDVFMTAVGSSRTWAFSVMLCLGRSIPFRIHEAIHLARAFWLKTSSHFIWVNTPEWNFLAI